MHSLQPDRTASCSLDDTELSAASVVGPPSPSSSSSTSSSPHSITDNLVSHMHLQQHSSSSNSSLQSMQSQEHTLKSRWEEASAALLHSSAASFLSRFTSSNVAGSSGGRTTGGVGNSSIVGRGMAGGLGTVCICCVCILTVGSCRAATLPLTYYFL